MEAERVAAEAWFATLTAWREAGYPRALLAEVRRLTGERDEARAALATARENLAAQQRAFVVGIEVAERTARIEGARGMRDHIERGQATRALRMFYADNLGIDYTGDTVPCWDDILEAAEARCREIGNRERDADVERQRAVWQEQVAAAEARGQREERAAVVAWLKREETESHERANAAQDNGGEAMARRYRAQANATTYAVMEIGRGSHVAKRHDAPKEPR